MRRSVAVLRRQSKRLCETRGQGATASGTFAVLEGGTACRSLLDGFSLDETLMRISDGRQAQQQFEDHHSRGWLRSWHRSKERLYTALLDDRRQR